MRKRNGRFLALVMAVAMAVTNVDVYSLRVSAKEYAGESAFVAGTTDAEDASGNETGTPSGAAGLVDIIAGDVQTESADAMQAAENDGSEEYLIDDTVGFTVTDVTVDAGSYVAEAKVFLECSESLTRSSNLYIMYTEEINAEFFKNRAYVSSQDLSEIYKVTYDYKSYEGESSKSIQIGNASTNETSDGLLKPSTIYTYRVVREVRTWDSSTRKYVTIYYFLTAPQTFTTAAPVETPSVTIGDISVDEYGYDREKITAIITNPNNELVGEMIIVPKDAVSAENVAMLYGDIDFSDRYHASIPTNMGEMQLRIEVYTGQGERSYIQKNIPIERRDTADRKMNISVEEEETGAKVTAKIDPWYDADADEYGYGDYGSFLLKLYQKTFSSYRVVGVNYKYSVCRSVGFREGEEGFFEELEAGDEYYIQIEDQEGNVLANEGTEEEPLIFHRSELKIYSENDFQDKSLYGILREKYGLPLTDGKLNQITEFNALYGYYSAGTNTDGLITTLEDIPKVLPNLREIVMDGHSICDISPLKQMVSLKEVSLQYNDIAELPDLSECEWTSLKLAYNYLNPEYIDVSKLPKALENTNVTDGYYRTNSIKIADTYYIDSEGRYPLILIYSGANKKYRDYTISVTIGDQTKEYAYERDKTYYQYGSNEFYFPDLKDLGLEANQKYSAKIAIKDQFATQLEEICEVDFKVKDAPNIEDIYESSARKVRKSLVVNISGSFEDSQIKTAYIGKNGEAVCSSESVYCTAVSKEDDTLYIDSLGKLQTKLKYLYTRLSITFYLQNIPAGDYDIVVETETGEQYVFANKFHSTDLPYITGTESALKGYDSTGDYCYIRVEGYNLDVSKVCPIITNEAGTEYTSLEDVILEYISDAGTYQKYIYKLKKNDNWEEIRQNPGFYTIAFNSEEVIIDQSRLYYGAVSTEIDLRNEGESINLNPINTWYDWKKQTIEMAFGKSIPIGTEVSATVKEEFGNNEILAVCSGIIDGNGRLSMLPQTVSGSTYILKDEESYELELTAEGKSKTIYWQAEYYNHYSNNSSNPQMSISTARYYETGTNTISMTASGTAETHTTNQLYAKIIDENTDKEIARSDEFYYSKSKDGKTDIFTLESWKLETGLAAGRYTLYIYEVVEGIEKDLGYKGFRVLDSLTDGFYQYYQYVNYNVNDGAKASIQIELPLFISETISDAEELKAFVEKNNLKLEVFDSDKKPVTIIATPTRSVAFDGIIFFDVSGLDKNATGYYFRITSNGRVGHDIYNGGNYYDDYAGAELGKWQAKSDSWGLSGSSVSMAYDSFYASSYEPDIPYLIKFYALSDLGTCIHSFSITSDELDAQGKYYFTSQDFEKLSKNEVYQCVMMSNRNGVKVETGYFVGRIADSETIAVNSISIVGSSSVIKHGETLQLQALISPADATNKSVTWSSSNEAVAAVDKNGLVTAVAPGTVEITVTTADGGKTASCTLTVQDNGTSNTVSVESVSITGRKSSIKEGETMQLQAVIIPEDATDKSVTWSSSDPSVATVDANGLVKAVAVGTTEITVTTMDGGRKAAFTLKVINLDTANSLHVEFADGMEFTYTGEKITPPVTVYYQGKPLAQDVDYTVSYINNVNASQDGAKVIVTGKTIAANATTNFTITRKNLNDPDIKAGTILVTSGSKAAPALYYGSYKLSAKDYINPDATKKFTENGSITLEGKGNFTGRRVLPVSVVEKGQLGKFKVEFKAKARTYNGEAQYLQDGELTARDAQSKNPLVENTDYVIVYPQNVTSAGTVKFTILGIGAYTGSVSKSYKIAPAKKAQSDFSVEIAQTVAYRQGGVTPGVTVYSEGSLLSAGRDYKVKYSANKKIGTAKYTITFQGNYKGSAKLKGTFEIKAASLNKAKVAVPDKAFLKAGKYISTPYVSVDGMALSKKDYTIKYMLGGKELTAKDTITEDMLQGGSAEITVVVTGKGNYDSATSATGTYHVSKTTADYDLSKAKVEIRDKSTRKKVSAFAFTGDEIKIDRQYEIYVTIGKSKTVLREGVDFTATYANKVNKGRATIILNGLGANSSQNTKYYGSKTAGFSIVRGIMNWL